MKILFYPFLVFIVSACSGEKTQTFESTFLSPEAESVLDSTIQYYTQNKKLAGISALVAKDGCIKYQKSFGMQNIEENRSARNNTLYRIASMTKPITTVALLQLLEKGLVNLDDSASQFIPEFKNAVVLQSDSTLVPANKPITIKQLLMHTAGLLPQGHPVFRAAKPYEKESLEQCAKTIAKLPLYHQPGERFTYGASTNIIGRIVEILSGETLDVYVQKEILDPLKMTSTFYKVPAEDTARIASFYSANGLLTLEERPIRAEMPYALGTRGLFTTTGDYFRFAQMLLNKGELDGIRILKQETVQLMTSDLLAPELHPLNVMGTSLPNTGFGLGLAILTGDPGKWESAPLVFPNLGNLPAGSYYWPGVTNTFWWADPHNKICGVFFSQTHEPTAYPAFQNFTQNLYLNTIYKVSRRSQ